MDLQNLRARLKGAWQMSGISQREFADRHGISYSTLNKFLKGRLRNPCLDQIHRYERAINQTPAN